MNKNDEKDMNMEVNDNTSAQHPHLEPNTSPAAANPTQDAPATRSRFIQRYRVEIILFFVFWISFGYFYHLRSGWNANTRFGLTMSIVHYGSLSIDYYHDSSLLSTGDKAYYNGHFYCDKSPALSFLAVPFYAAIRPLLDMSSSNVKTVTAYRWTIFWTVCLLGAIAAALFYRLMRLFSASNQEGLLLTFFLIYGTNVGGYTSMFYPYLPATACMLAAYVLLLSARKNNAAFSAGRAALIGFFISMAGYFEFTFGLAGMVMMLLTFLTMRPRWKFAYTILGAIPPVIALFAYNYILFGSLNLPYKYEYHQMFRDGMAAGFMGITKFNPNVLYFITIHPYKGIFFFSPILLFFLIGLLYVKRLGNWSMPRSSSEEGQRFAWDAVAALLIFVGYLIFNSSYFTWWGGWSMGSRHLIPMIPFLFMPILACLRRSPKLASVVILAGVVSLLLNFPAIAVDPQIPSLHGPDVLNYPDFRENLQSPWLTDILPAFYKHGQLAVTPFTRMSDLAKRFEEPGSSVPGLLQLIPLFAIWILGFARAWKVEEEV